jgi:DNA-dependent RNA polymerase auxiliary subunit epsilon
LDKKEWLILNFTLPKEQSRVRVSVWRKLKKSGAVNIGQSMWVLPNEKNYLETFNEISGEITQNNGSAYITNADFVENESSDNIIAVFNNIRDDEYREFMDKCDDYFLEIEKETKKENFTFAELEENKEEYDKLAEWLKKISKRDFFGAPLKKQSEEALQKCKQLLNGFADKVYQANDTGDFGRDK